MLNDGTGNAIAVTSTVNVAATKDAPTLTTTTSTPSYANTAGDQLLFSGPSINAVDSGQTIKGLKLTVSGVDGTLNDRVKFDDEYIALTNSNSGATMANGM